MAPDGKKRPLRTLYFICILLSLITPALFSNAVNIESDSQESGEVITKSPFEYTENFRQGSRANVSDFIEYVVIGPESFRSAAEPFVSWKTKKGVPAIYKSTEGIFSEYSGLSGDELVKIRQFLIDTRSGHPEFKWVLILGDSDVIPVRQLYAGAKIFNMHQFYDSDHYLASLNGSWDSDGDGIYGEHRQDEDWESELFVGRIPVGSSNETQTALEKVISYERFPPDGEWFKKALIMGSLMDAPNVFDDPATEFTDEGYNDYKDNAFEVMKKALDFFPPHFSLTELYDYDRIIGGDYNLENDTLTRENAVSEFNYGYSLINFAGQARFNGNSIMQYESADGTGTYLNDRYFAWGDLFTYTDAKNVDNGGMLPLMMMPTCDAANFTELDDTNLEVLFSAVNGGIIGLISSTGPSHRGESVDGNSYGNWWEDEQFWKIFFVDDLYQPGVALAELKLEYAENILAYADSNPRIYREAVKGNLEGLTLLGDPEVPIWTDIPGELTYELNNLSTGSVSVEIAVSDKSNGEPVPDALVALSGNDVYLYGRTGDNGILTIDSEIDKTGSADLTITAHNYRAVEKKVQIDLAEPRIKNINDMVMNEDDSVSDLYILSEIISDADTDFDELSIDLVSQPSEGGLTVDDNGGIDIFPSPNWNGIVRNSLRVSDGEHTVYMNFTVTILSVNDPPVLRGVPDEIVAWEDNLYVYDNITAYDPDSPELIFSDDSDLFDIDPKTGRISFIPSFSEIGEYDVCLQVTDGADSTKKCIAVNVFAIEDPPTIKPISRLSLRAGERFTYTIQADDDDGDDLTYSIEPDWIKIDPDTGVIDVTPGSDKIGNHDVTVYVTDGSQTSSEKFELNVRSTWDFKMIGMILFYIFLVLVLVFLFVQKRYSMHKNQNQKRITGEDRSDKEEDDSEKPVKNKVKRRKKLPESRTKKIRARRNGK